VTGLRIFEKHPEADAYRFGPSFTPHAIVATEKRFTDAELAAEHYRASFYHESEVADNDGYDGSLAAREYYRQSRIFYRFATLPHYDEDTQ